MCGSYSAKGRICPHKIRETKALAYSPLQVQCTHGHESRKKTKFSLVSGLSLFPNVPILPTG